MAKGPTAGRQSEVGAIRQLFLKHAKDAFVSPEAIERQWRGLNYTAPPNLMRAVAEYDRFVSLLSGLNIDIHFVPKNRGAGLDSLYVRDTSVACDRGMILCRMGKDEREMEPSLVEKAFQGAGVPVHGFITGEGRLEGGDVVWVDERTLAVARSYRTNDEGIRQLKELVRGCADEIIVVSLPHWRGPEDVFHLMSIFSPIDHDLALVYSPLMPVTFREALVSRGMTLIDVPDPEFAMMGCNVLALAPRRCVMLEGNPEARARLESAGALIHEFEGREICMKGGGGPTCLTRPTLRAVRS